MLRLMCLSRFPATIYYEVYEMATQWRQLKLMRTSQPSPRDIRLGPLGSLDVQEFKKHIQHKLLNKK
jgi:hypothetical protein